MYNNSPLPTTPAVTAGYWPTIMAEGTAINQRVGQQIKVKYINLRWRLTASTTHCAVRIVALLVRQTDQVGIGSVADVFDAFAAGDVEPSYLPATVPVSYRPLFDKHIQLGFVDSTNHYAGGPQIVRGSTNIRVPGQTTFISAGGTLTDTAGNHVCILAWATNTNNICLLRTRLSYEDA